MTGFWSDFRGALRGLGRAPVFLLTAVLTLGLGIGINSTAFSLINSVFFKPLPIEKRDRMVNLYTTRANGSGATPLSLPDFRDLQESQTIFEGVLGYGVSLAAIGESRAETVFIEIVTGNYFSLLGLEATEGRLLGEDDAQPGAMPAVVISKRLRDTQFAGQAEVVGSHLTLNGQAYRVAGVAPAEFSGLIARGLPMDAWVGFSQLGSFREISDRRSERWLHVRGVRRSDVEMTQVEAFLEAFGSRLEGDYPESNEGRRFLAYSSQSVILNPEADGALSLVAALLQAGAAVLLIVICANLANLFLARSVGRLPEYSIRQALGAGRLELLRRPLLEALLVALGGGLLGLSVAVWSSSFVNVFAPPLPVPVRLDLGVDWRVILFSLTAAAATSLIFATATRSQIGKSPADSLLREGNWAQAGRKQLRLNRFLLVPQMAFAVLILVVAGLFLRSVRMVADTDPGFDTQNTALASVELRLAGYDTDQAAEFLNQVKQQLEAHPEITRAAFSSWVPAGALYGRSAMSVWTPEGSMELATGQIGPDFLETLGIPVEHGRSFERSDFARESGVALVSQSAARLLWPGQSAVGQTLRRGGPEGTSLRVVGVARDTTVETLGEETSPFLYTPFQSAAAGMVMVVARQQAGNQAVVRVLQDTVREMDSRVPIFNASTFASHIDVQVYPFRMAAAIGSFLGVATLALVLVGLYGLVALNVSQRVQELGIRMALGARPINLVRLVLKDMSRLVLGSIAAGLLLAVAASSALEGLVFGIQAQDPFTFVLVPLSLLLICLIATCAPLLKPLRGDPARVLRIAT